MPHPLFRTVSPRGHRTEPATYPIDLGGRQSFGYFCTTCGYDLEPEPRGKYRHLNSRAGAEWLAKLNKRGE